jgi:hypothetical protein
MRFSHGKTSKRITRIFSSDAFCNIFCFKEHITHILELNEKAEDSKVEELDNELW